MLAIGIGGLPSVKSSRSIGSLSNRMEPGHLIDRRPDDDYYIDEGSVSGILLTGAGETNNVSVIAVDDRGYFFLNDEFVAELNLSDRMDAGEIEVAAAFFEGHEVPGYSTEYSEFTVWPLP